MPTTSFFDSCPLLLFMLFCDALSFLQLKTTPIVSVRTAHFTPTIHNYLSLSIQLLWCEARPILKPLLVNFPVFAAMSISHISEAIHTFAPQKKKQTKFSC